MSVMLGLVSKTIYSRGLRRVGGFGRVWGGVEGEEGRGAVSGF